MTNKKSDIMWRIYLVYFLTVAFSVLIICRVFYLQFIDGDRYREMARHATMRYESIDAARGDILADDGRVLATSIPVYEIRMDLDKKVVSDELYRQGIDSLSMMLSTLFHDRSASEYKRMIGQARGNKERYFLVKRNVSYNQLLRLKKFPIFREGRFKGGLLVVERNRRETPFKSLALRTIGYEREGVYVGLEGAYREYLEGVQGKRLMQRISGGNWMPVNDENEIKSQNGKDIITTLNLNMQDVAENALLKQLVKYQAHHGTVVIMEVSTGKVKAITNLTRNAGGYYEESFNYALGESAEPGSTFKLVSMIALLEDGAVNKDDFIQTGDGTINYADRTMRDARDGGFGTITVKDAFALSSNVGISMMIDQAYRKNPSKFIDHISQLMLDKPLGLEIRGEGAPIIPRPDKPGWSGVTLPWMSIGYNLTMTPLQTLVLYNAIANNGRMMKPMFVEEVRWTGRTIKKFEPQVMKSRICSQSTLTTVQEMLVDVVENGTGSGIRTPLYPIAGKTGTAQVAKAGGGYRGGDRKIYRASFAGYFPADNPLYSMIVVVHDPKGWIYTGSQVAAPIFREISDKIFATQVNVNDNYILASANTAVPEHAAGRPNELRALYSFFDFRVKMEDKNTLWANAHLADNETIVVSERTFEQNLVPNVVGMGLMDALYVLENAGMRVRFNGRGMVRSQSIRSGTRIVNGSEIVLRLS